MNLKSFANMGRESESELIGRLKRGDAMAFTLLYNMYFDLLYNYAVQFTKSQHDAEDVVQEVFVRLWNGRDRLADSDSVKALLYRVAKNLLIDAYRRNLNSPVYEDYVNYFNTLRSDGGDPVEYREFYDNLVRQIDRLPPAQSMIVKMSKFEGLTNKQIAAELQIQEQVVKNQLSRGLKTVKQNLGLLHAVLFMLLY